MTYEFLSPISCGYKIQGTHFIDGVLSKFLNKVYTQQYPKTTLPNVRAPEINLLTNENKIRKYKARMICNNSKAMIFPDIINRVDVLYPQ
jgi:hypothetical protein